MSDNVPERLAAVRQRIATAARKAGRPADAVTLLAVTKTVPLESIEPWSAAGVAEFGENRVQEALGKYLSADGRRTVQGRFHLIGPLQTNKAKKAVQFFDVVQSLDRLDLAKELDRHAAAAGKVLPCLVEVKISPEVSKAGLAPEALDEFLEAARAFPNLSIEGLMGIPPADAPGDAARPYFARLRRLFEKAKLKTLSMGMSADFEAAIEEGSTMVRLGTILFGARA